MARPLKVSICALALVVVGVGLSSSGQTAPDATTDAATGVHANEATLHGTVTAPDEGALVWFEYGTDTSYGTDVVPPESPIPSNTTESVHFDLDSLAANTTYHYRVVAGNPNGTTYGEGSTFQTLPQNPTVTNVVADTDPICESDLTQQVTVTFSRAMAPAVQPEIQFIDGTLNPLGTWVSQGGSWSSGDTVWTETFLMTDDDREENAGIDVVGAQDSYGNVQSDYSPEWEFYIDTVKPEVFVSFDTDPVWGGDLTQELIIGFSAGTGYQLSMQTDGSADPVISFSHGTWIPSAGYWWTSVQWRQTFTLVDNNEVFDDVVITVTGTEDAAGNLQEPYSPHPTIDDEFDIDTTKNPTAVIAVNDVLITDADDGSTFTVTLTFAQTMDTGHTPTIDFDSDVEGSGTLVFDTGTWSTAAHTDDTYTASYTATDVGETTSDIDIEAYGGQNPGGEIMNVSTLNDAFDVDTENPVVVSIQPSLNPLSEPSLGAAAFTLTAEFSEPMDQAASPSVSFPSEDPLAGTLSLASEGFVDADTYRWIYDAADANETILDIDVRVASAEDLAGNLLVQADAPDLFDIDTVKPRVLSVVADTQPIFDGDLEQEVIVTYDSAMDTDAQLQIQFIDHIFNPLGTWTSLGGSWSNGDTVWTERFLMVDDDREENVGIDVVEGLDAAGNQQEDYSPEWEFFVDTVRPEVFVFCDTDPVTDADLTQTLIVGFSAGSGYQLSMQTDGSADPVITFSHGTWIADPGFWWTWVQWMQTFTLVDNDEVFAEVTVNVTGTEDAAGNLQEVHVLDPVLPDEFVVDTVGPVPPIIAPLAGGAILLESRFYEPGSFDDVNLDTWTATVDYGDGTGVQALVLSDHSFVLEHRFGALGSYTVTVTVDDGTGFIETATCLVDVVLTIDPVYVVIPMGHPGSDPIDSTDNAFLDSVLLLADDEVVPTRCGLPVAARCLRGDPIVGGLDLVPFGGRFSAVEQYIIVELYAVSGAEFIEHSERRYRQIVRYDWEAGCFRFEIATSELEQGAYLLRLAPPECEPIELMIEVTEAVD